MNGLTHADGGRYYLTFTTRRAQPWCTSPLLEEVLQFVEEPLCWALATFFSRISFELAAARICGEVGFTGVSICVARDHRHAARAGVPAYFLGGTPGPTASRTGIFSSALPSSVGISSYRQVRRGGERNRHHPQCRFSGVALEHRVRLDLHYDVKVADGPPLVASPSPDRADAVVGIDAGWNLRLPASTCW